MVKISLQKRIYTLYLKIKTMKVKLPIWAETLEDEALITLVGFMYRICQQYGYDNWYDMFGADMAIIANKNLEGLIPWLREKPEFKENVKLTYFEEGSQARWTLAFAKKYNQDGLRVCYKEITTNRAKFVWFYLLGVSNYDLVYEGDLKPIKHNKLNNRFFSELKIDRTPSYKEKKPLQKRGRKSHYKPWDGTQETD